LLVFFAVFAFFKLIAPADDEGRLLPRKRAAASIEVSWVTDGDGCYSEGAIIGGKALSNQCTLSTIADDGAEAASSIRTSGN
jgi:hypothetical protein